MRLRETEREKGWGEYVKEIIIIIIIMSVFLERFSM